MSRPLRIGLIGAGANTRAKHIPGFQALAGVEVVAVANRSVASATKVAAEFGIPRAAANAEEIIGAPDIDAVCLGTWPDQHAPLTIAALRAGKHVLTEARMAWDHAAAVAMLEESRRHAGLVAQIVPAPFSLPFDATIAGLLAAGELGELREAHLTATNAAGADPAAPLTWRQDRRCSGDNTLMLGIYYETLRRWLGCDPAQVAAEATIFTRERRDETGVVRAVEVPDAVTVLGRYADGLRLLGHFSGVETSAPRAEIRLNGSRGGLRLDLVRGELWLGRGGGAEQRVEIAPEKRGSWQVEADFVASIREGAPVRLTDFATGERYMRVTSAVRESWTAGGRWVTV